MAKLLERETTDENFAHCLGLVPPLRMWAQGVRPGDRLRHNDMNMVALPLEMLTAFLKREIAEGLPLAATCQEVLEQVAQIEALMIQTPREEVHAD